MVLQKASTFFTGQHNGQWAKKYNRPFAAQKAKKAMAEALLRI